MLHETSLLEIPIMTVIRSLHLPRLVVHSWSNATIRDVVLYTTDNTTKDKQEYTVKSLIYSKKQKVYYVY